MSAVESLSGLAAPRHLHAATTVVDLPEENSRFEQEKVERDLFQSHGLTTSLIGLSRILTIGRPLEDVLSDVASYAVHAIPGAEAGGVALLEAGRPQTVVTTAECLNSVNSMQYALNEGPCVSAVADGHTVVSGNLGGEARWPHFGPRAGRLGVHSALSLPLVLPDRTIGAINVFARRRDAFDARAVIFGEAFAGPAAVSVANAQVLAHAERVVGQLTTALNSRAEIDQALGIMMSRTGSSAQEAFSRLRDLSQARGVKVSDISRDLVTEAMNKARARRSDQAGSVRRRQGTAQLSDVKAVDGL